MAIIDPDLWKPQGINDLEPNAWEALRETERSICVIAGAGAGKTEFLAQKATYLLQTGICPTPRRILAISFKRDAARNLAERVQRRCPPEQARRFDSLTFDAFTKGLLDRFRAAIPEPFSPSPDYHIYFPSQMELEDFLKKHNLYGINTRILENAIASTRLPLSDPKDETNKAVQLYWNEYIKSGCKFLTFSMINRLVEWLLRENIYIRRALQATYPFVFLDEFQDTTYAQFELLLTAFEGSRTIFTAVGDDKQSIMRWAGAMPDAFDRFKKVFNAEPISLVSNWRSHKELVRIQHAIAHYIDPNTKVPKAKAERHVDGDIAAIWQYQTGEEEAEGIAAWIAREINAGIAPHEIAILVRHHASEVEERLIPHFSKYDIKLRNVARSIGEITIQDLLGEDLTAILLPLLRLGTTNVNPSAWNKTRQNLEFFEGIHPDDFVKQERLQQRLEEFVRRLRTKMQRLAPSAERAKTISQEVLHFVNPSILRSAFTAYQRHQDFDRVWNGFVQLFAENAEDAQSWTEALDRFEGVGQVPLMTIHKSKGLEFHTIIFYGFDNGRWWSLIPARKEELNSFFVAFTRAKQRAFFTLSEDRGEPITWIEQVLNPVGVYRVRGPLP